MVTAHWYPSAKRRSLLGELDLVGDTLSARLLAAAHTPALDTHDDWADISADEASGTGYTAGGQALTTKAVAYTTANSFTTQWAASTAYDDGDVVRPTTGNGFLYRCRVAGTSGGAEPTWPTDYGEDIADNTATWELIGRGVVTFDFDNPSWDATGGSLAAGYCVIVDDTHATDALVALIDFEGEETATNDTFTVVIDPLGALADFVAP